MIVHTYMQNGLLRYGVGEGSTFKNFSCFHYVFITKSVFSTKNKSESKCLASHGKLGATNSKRILGFRVNQILF